MTESYEYARKEQNMRSDYYYAPVQNTPQPMQGQNQQMNDMSGTVHAAFGNASQKLQAQPMNMAAAAQEEPALSKKELKRQEKEAKKAAKKAKGRDARPMQSEPMMQQDPMMAQPQMAPQQNVQPQMAPQQQAPQQMQQVPPQQPTMVQSSIEEPDVNVDMIDL